MPSKFHLLVTGIFAAAFFLSSRPVEMSLSQAPDKPAAKVAAEKNSVAALIGAEYNFAHGAIKSKKIAFDKYLADDCVVLRKGSIINAKKFWADIGKDTTQLIWHPVFVDVASSGEFGYTTGAWQIKQNSKAKEAMYYGEYITVWQKQANGEWKVTVDLGTNHQKPAPPEKAAMPHDASISATKPKMTLTNAEAGYNLMLKNNLAGAYKNYFSNAVRVFRPDEMPYTGLASALKNAGNKIIYSCTNAKQSSSKSGDFAYSYGVVTKTIKGKETKTNYLRMWKVEGGDWKIVLDVVTG